MGIFTIPHVGMTAWDPDSIASGITDAEEAVIYISQKLVKLGCKVLVFGDPPKDSKHSLPGANPRFVELNLHDALSKPGSESLPKIDIAISWRIPIIAELLHSCAKKGYYVENLREF